ncbi:GNAT family N-acetyltransferase [Duganella callida]|uniref:GNAT family N-acetyltransferase n=1 Tax=Duganella callida TaxID=2561932 RepID=A0A4Y9S788_9BURK|nr:GNAT family N-acetyltransferase [Duganella callida]TFW17280.1 GNAT family N-acetyltransferase [Duganella callida]
MSKVMARLARELRGRGLVGFTHFVARRFVQWRADVLYEQDLRLLPAAAAPVPAPSARVTLIDRGNFGSEATAALERAVLVGGNVDYVSDLRGTGQLWIATDEHGAVASYAFVVFASFYKHILHEDSGTPIICNCVTMPAHRGQGLYPRLLRESCQRLAAQGFGRVIITCEPDNRASIRGIEKAGFQRVKTLYSLILFTRLIAFQRVAWAPGQSLAENAAFR